MMEVISRRTLLKGASALTLGAVTGGSSLLYSRRIEPQWMDVTTTTFHLPRLDRAFTDYRIVQLSDLHVDGVWMTKERLASIVERTNEQRPDLVVITGDFVTRLHSETGEVLSALRQLQGRDGVFAVLGNHDHWTSAATVRAHLREHGIHELSDQVHTIVRGSAMLHLIGMDDLWPSSHVVHPVWAHQERLTSLLAHLPTTGAAILLVHEPDFADVAASTGRIDLQLSGHTHGGQVRLPWSGALRTAPLGEKYIAGRYTIQSMQHYTNRGLGMVPPRIRLNCRPEIATFICQPGSLHPTP